jgi:hypothetical protein
MNCTLMNALERSVGLIGALAPPFRGHAA